MTVWHNTKVWIRKRQIALIAYGIVLSLVLLFLWPSIVITIHSGEAGVLFSRFFGGTVLNRVYGEGVQLILPWNLMIVYNTRVQEMTVNSTVLCLEGLPVTIELSIRFFPRLENLPYLHQRVGPEFRDRFIAPAANAALIEAVGDYRPEDIYTIAPEKLQEVVLENTLRNLAGGELIILERIMIRKILLPEKVTEAINQKFVTEQQYLAYHFVLLKAREELKRRALEAESIRLFQETVNKGLTEPFLRWAGIEATKQLAESHNAKILIVGGKDGLPIILNTDTLGGGAGEKADTQQVPGPARSESPKPGMREAVPIRPADQEGPHPSSPSSSWQSALDALKSLDAMMEEFDRKFLPIRPYPPEHTTPNREGKP